VEVEWRAVKRHRSFEWGYQDELIQCHLTEFNGIQMLMMEDDHSRDGWAPQARFADARGLPTFVGVSMVMLAVARTASGIVRPDLMRRVRCFNG
jgi:hypothetical protein